MPIINVITITEDETKTNTERDLIAETGYRELAGQKLNNYVRRLTTGQGKPVVRTEVNAVKASGTLTGTTVIATDAIAINGLTLTCVASGATADQFNIGITDTLTMASLAAVINGHASLVGIVTATSEATVTTVSAARPGLIGNCITLTSADATIVASVAKLTAGTDGEVEKTHYYGSAT